MPADTLQLRHGLHYCVVRDRAVFLDLPANRYFALAPALDAGFREAMEPGHKGASRSSIADRLLSLGILEKTGSPRPAPRIFALPTPDRGPPPSAGAAPATTALLVARYMGALAEVRMRPFARIIERRRRKAALHREADMDVERIRTVIAAIPLADHSLSASRRCLPRSLAIFDAMAARGFWPELVIGVSYLGFAAHCWLQHGDMVLNDEPDNVRRYAPILAI